MNNVRKKSAKKNPFAKQSSSIATVVIALLFAFNFAYSYAIGIPFARVVVDSYVESVYAIGDAQVHAYEVMGAALVALANTPVGFNVASAEYASESVATVNNTQAPGQPEPLLRVEPNRLR